jgi:hypothetical protein
MTINCLLMLMMLIYWEEMYEHTVKGNAQLLVVAS